MANKRYRPEEIITKQQESDILIRQSNAVVVTIRKLGISDVTYYRWHKKYGGMQASQVKRLKALEKENSRLRKAMSSSPGFSKRAIFPSSDAIVAATTIELARPNLFENTVFLDLTLLQSQSWSNIPLIVICLLDPIYLPNKDGSVSWFQCRRGSWRCLRSLTVST